MIKNFDSETKNKQIDQLNLEQTLIENFKNDPKVQRFEFKNKKRINVRNNDFRQRFQRSVQI